MSTHRLAAWLAGIWAGILGCIGALAAPTAFATLAVTDAGRFAARLFAQEAYLSLAVAILLFALLRLGQRSGPTAGSTAEPINEPTHGSALSPAVLLVLGTLFCTVAGYFAVQPLMAAARAGEGRWSFGALHAVSGGLFVLKGALVAVLAWLLAPRRPPVNPAATS